MNAIDLFLSMLIGVLLKSIFVLIALIVVIFIVIFGFIMIDEFVKKRRGK